MKQLTKIVALIAAILFAVSPSAFAVTTSTPATSISATVDQVLSLAMTIKEETSASPLTFGPAVTVMNHGTLVRPTNPDGTPGALRGKAFHVWLGVNTSGRPYTITSTMAAMTNGATTLPPALGVFPGAAANNGATPPVAIGGTQVAAQDAVGTGKLLYTSSAAGPSGVIELVYGLSGGLAGGALPFPTWQPIPPGQLSGTYTSTITFTLTA